MSRSRRCREAETEATLLVTGLDDAKAAAAPMAAGDGVVLRRLRRGASAGACDAAFRAVCDAGRPRPLPARRRQAVGHASHGHARSAAQAIRRGRSVIAERHSRATLARRSATRRPSRRPAIGRPPALADFDRAEQGRRAVADTDPARRADVLRLGRRTDLDPDAARRRCRRRRDLRQAVADARRTRDADPRAGRDPRRGRGVPAAGRGVSRP